MVILLKQRNKQQNLRMTQRIQKIYIKMVSKTKLNKFEGKRS